MVPFSQPCATTDSLFWDGVFEPTTLVVPVALGGPSMLHRPISYGYISSLVGPYTWDMRHPTFIMVGASWRGMDGLSFIIQALIMTSIMSTEDGTKWFINLIMYDYRSASSNMINFWGSESSYTNQKKPHRFYITCRGVAKSLQSTHTSIYKHK